MNGNHPPCQALDGACDRTTRNRGGKYCSGHAEQKRLGRPFTTLRTKRPDHTTPPPCKFDGCDKPSNNLGLCDGHYEHHRRGQELRPLMPRRASKSTAIRNGRGEKHCPICDTWRPESDFNVATANYDGLSHLCKSCYAGSLLTRKFNITPREYSQMLDAQGGVCAICKKAPSDKRLAVDHDHSCCPETGSSCGKCIRGLLCWMCNTAIGNMNDDIARLEAAIAYLRSNTVTLEHKH